MADLIDFSNIGKGIDTQMGNAALQGQQLGVNAATIPGRVQATNAGNAASVSTSGLQINNNQRQQNFQMQSAALAANPNATPQDYQALSNQYPEFGSQVAQNQQQTQINWQNIRTKMTASGVATVAAVKARIDANDIPGALTALESQAKAQENSGDVQGAAATRAYENMIQTNPTQAGQIASSILNANGANNAQDLYGNQRSQAAAVVAQNTVPAAIGQANSQASQAGTAAQYAPAQAQAGIASTQAGTAQTVANTGLTNQQIALPPAAMAASQPEYNTAQQYQATAQQAGEYANLFKQIAPDTSGGVLGATWDNAARKWTGDTSRLQQLRQDASSLVTQAETASMVNGNFTDAATARAVQNVPQITDNPQAWATYLSARQQLLEAKSAWSNARGDWARGNNGSFGPAVRDMTIQMPNGNSSFVKQGQSFTQFSKKAAPTYAPTQTDSFDPTK